MDQDIKQPAVSVILPVYNCEKYVRQSVESVLKQTFADFELIIINDGSTDKSLETIMGFNDPRIKIIDQQNQGLITTLNKGLGIARAKYIARIDADDFWSDETKLEKQMNYLSENPDCVLVGTWTKMINEKEKVVYRLKHPTTDKKIRSWLLVKDCFVHPSVVFHKETALNVGGYATEDKCMEDYALWMKMGLKGKMANIGEFLMTYRINPEGITKKNRFLQTKNSFAAVKRFKNFYPNYPLAFLKWNLKLLLLRIKNVS